MISGFPGRQVVADRSDTPPGLGAQQWWHVASIDVPQFFLQVILATQVARSSLLVALLVATCGVLVA
jgi:hypothetical protein